MEPWYRPLRRLSSFAVFFALAVFVAREILATTDNLAMFWPAAGVVVLYALRARSRVEVALIAIGAFAIIVPWYRGAGFTIGAAILVGLANAANPVVTRWVYRLLGGPADTVVRRTASVYRLTVSGLAGAGVATVFGVLMQGAQVGYVDAHNAPAWFFRYIAGTFLVGRYRAGDPGGKSKRTAGARPRNPAALRYDHPVLRRGVVGCTAAVARIRAAISAVLVGTEVPGGAGHDPRRTAVGAHDRDGHGGAGGHHCRAAVWNPSPRATPMSSLSSSTGSAPNTRTSVPWNGGSGTTD